MVDEVTKQNPDVVAGVKMMHHILKHHGGEALVKFVEWGQNIIDETGKITKADFTADPDEAPITKEEKSILDAAKPPIITRRNMMLGIPSAAIAMFSVSRLGAKVAKDIFESDAKEKKDEKNPPNKAKTKIFSAISEKLDKFSSTPIEILGIATLLNEVFDMLKDYEPEKFAQIENAISELADNMGIGDPTPTYRLRIAQQQADATQARFNGRD
jgi:hypothetical protein